MSDIKDGLAPRVLREDREASLSNGAAVFHCGSMLVTTTPIAEWSNVSMELGGEDKGPLASYYNDPGPWKPITAEQLAAAVTVEHERRGRMLGRRGDQVIVRYECEIVRSLQLDGEWFDADLLAPWNGGGAEYAIGHSTRSASPILILRAPSRYGLAMPRHDDERRAPDTCELCGKTIDAALNLYHVTVEAEGYVLAPDAWDAERMAEHWDTTATAAKVKIPQYGDEHLDVTERGGYIDAGGYEFTLESIRELPELPQEASE